MLSCCKLTCLTRSTRCCPNNSFKMRLSTLAEYCYGEPTQLVYRGELAWCERGQQGCPMMGPLFCLSRCHMLREAQQASSRPMPEFRPAFADDGFSGGPVLDVWEQSRQEIRLAETYGLKVGPSKCTLYLLAGEAFRGDVSRLQALGVKVVTGANLLMLKTPISQDADFLHSFQKSKRTELECIFEALERLPRHHVAFTLMRQGVSYGKIQYVCTERIKYKIQYWCRTVPRAHLGELLEFFHLRAKHALEHMLNVPSTPSSGPKQSCPWTWAASGWLALVLNLACRSSTHQMFASFLRVVPPTCVRTPCEGELAAIQHLTPGDTRGSS